MDDVIWQVNVVFLLEFRDEGSTERFELQTDKAELFSFYVRSQRTHFATTEVRGLDGRDMTCPTKPAK